VTLKFFVDGFWFLIERQRQIQKMWEEADEIATVCFQQTSQ
jgi:hypothetical protein